MKNRICELLGIKYPVLQGGMTWVSEPNLASAVCEAGGIGTLAAGNMPGDMLREEIKQMRELTKNKFAVNLILVAPNFPSCYEVVVEEKIPVVTFGAGNCGPYVEKLKNYGAIVIPVVASVALAKRLQKYNIDALIAEGMESGGHIGETSTMPMIPQMADALSLPVIAAGGIADGRGMAAAFALGAEGVQLGTCLVVAHESRAHDNYKNAIIRAHDRATAVTGRSIGKPVRALKNMLTLEFKEMESKGAGEFEIESLAVGRLRKAVMEGDIIHGSVMMGQVAGLINKRDSVKNIIENMVKEANETFLKMGLIQIPVA